MREEIALQMLHYKIIESEQSPGKMNLLKIGSFVSQFSTDTTAQGF